MGQSRVTLFTPSLIVHRAVQVYVTPTTIPVFETVQTEDPAPDNEKPPVFATSDQL